MKEVIKKCEEKMTKTAKIWMASFPISVQDVQIQIC